MYLTIFSSAKYLSMYTVAIYVLLWEFSVSFYSTVLSLFLYWNKIIWHHCSDKCVTKSCNRFYSYFIIEILKVPSICFHHIDITYLDSFFLQLHVLQIILWIFFIKNTIFLEKQSTFLLISSPNNSGFLYGLVVTKFTR